MSVRRVGTGPRVVWIHGLGESSASFDPIVARMPDVSHVLPDLPGYGRSAWPDAPMGLDALADHLAAWAASEPPAVWIGHSMGGVLALMVAERAPVRAIVDVEGNVTRGDCTFSGRAAAYDVDAFCARGLAELRARVYEDGLASPALRGYASALWFASPRVFHRHACDLVTLSEADELAPRLARLSERVPTLYIAGVPDGICEASRARLTACGVPWLACEPAGHWVYLDQPDQFGDGLKLLQLRFGSS